MIYEKEIWLELKKSTHDLAPMLKKYAIAFSEVFNNHRLEIKLNLIICLINYNETYWVYY